MDAAKILDKLTCKCSAEGRIGATYRRWFRSHRHNTPRHGGGFFMEIPDRLYKSFLDSNADQYVRSRMCETVAMVVLQNSRRSAALPPITFGW